MKPVHESPLEAIARCLREVCRSTGLRKARVVGKSIRAHCRRRDDRHASLYIYERAGSDGIYRWFYKCHSCGDKGTLVDLIAQETGLSRYEAARVVSRYLGEEISSTPVDDVRREIRDDAAVYDLSAEYCHLIAWVDSSFCEKLMRTQHDYLKGRTSLRQIRQLGLGISPNYVVRKSTLESFLLRKGRTDLLEDMTRVLERVACRVVIPIRDESAHVVSICTRYVGGAEQNRYRNDGANGNALLGIHVAHDAIRRAGYAIVVEGPFDMLTLRDLGGRCLAKVLEEGKGEGERRALIPGIGIVDTDGDVGERPGDHLALDHRPLPADGDAADTLGKGHHVGEGVGRAPDVPDVLADVVAFVKDADDPDRRRGVEPDGDVPPPEDRPFPEQGPVPANRLQGAAGAGMVELAERGASAAHALVVDLDLAAVDGGEDPPAGALRHHAACRVVGGVPAPLLFREEDASLLDEAVHPVLNGAPGGVGGLRDIGHREGAPIERHLTHQPQVLFSPFKNP